MKNFVRVIIVSVCLLVPCKAGLSVTIDFDTLPGAGALPAGTEIADQFLSFGAVFSSTDGGPLVQADTQPSSLPNFLVGNADELQPIVVDFSLPMEQIDVTLISVGDSTVTATALASDLTTVLDTVSITNPGAGQAPGPGAHDPIMLVGDGIAQVRFEITDLIDDDGFGIDDLYFREYATATADNYIWTEATGGSWTVGNNWDQGSEPNGAAHDVFIRNKYTSDAVTVDLPPATAREINNLTIDPNGAGAHELSLGNNSRLDVNGDIANDGVISLNSTGFATSLRIKGSDLAISGSGQITLGDGGPNSIDADGAYELTNGAAHTISGVGNVGSNNASIVNLGTIDANVLGGTLTIDPRSTGAVAFDNQGTAQASGGGTLLLTGLGGGEFGGTGTYEALAGSALVIDKYARLDDATFTTVDDGVVRVAGNSSVYFHGLTNNGAMEVDDNGLAVMYGAVANTGTIGLNSTSQKSAFVLGGDIELSGGGTLEMSGSLARVFAAGSYELTNVDNTISGEGNIGHNSATVVNQGIIDANVSGGSLTLDPATASGDAFDNQGTAQASGGGTLVLTGSGGGHFGGTGTYQALAGSEILLQSNATINGSILDTVDDGQVRVADGSIAYLNDVTNNGALIVGDNSDANLNGTLVNAGTITLNSSGLQSDLALGSNLMLSGGGTLSMVGLARINGIPTATLTNVDNTLQGEGNIGANSVSILNQAVVDGNLSGGTLTIDPGSLGQGSFDNEGTVQASNGGIVALSGSGGGVFEGTGVWQALAGSQIILNNDAELGGITLTTVDDGVVRVADGETAELNDVINAADIQVGNGASITIKATAAMSNLATITLSPVDTASSLQIGSDVSLADGGTVNLNGPLAEITASGDHLLTNVDNLIRGEGTIGGDTARIFNQATIDADVPGGILTLDPRDAALSFDNEGTVQASNGGIVALSGSGGGDFGGTGTYQALAGSEIVLADAVELQSTTLATVDDGLVRIADGDVATFNDVQNNGALVVAAGRTAVMTGNTVNAGTISVDGGTIEATGTLSIEDIAALDFSNGSISAESITDDFDNFSWTGGDLAVDSFQGNLNNLGGTLLPAGLTDVTGDYSQSGGALVLDIAGTDPLEYDRLSVVGNLTPGGSLELVLDPAFEAAIAAGYAFDVLDWGTLAPATEFDTVTLPPLPDLEWDQSQLYTHGILAVVAPSAVHWDGGIGNWIDAMWGGAAPAADRDMIIDADTADSIVTVAADFITGGSGPAASVVVGETYQAELIVAAANTLDVTGPTSVGASGKISVDVGAQINTDTATIELGGKLTAGLQGAAGNTGMLNVTNQLTIEEFDDAGTIHGGADAINVDWVPGDNIDSTFGGTYRVAEYTGTPLVPGGTMTNSEGNIGTAYIKNVAYDLDVNGDGSLYAVEIELYNQGVGDTDLDGTVGPADLASFGLGWSPNATDKTWFEGDFDFDGSVGPADLAAFGLAWAPNGIAFPATSGVSTASAVPEPSTVLMLLIGMSGLLIYRKRR